MAAPTSQARICVFCSTQNGRDETAADAARKLAQLMHENDIVLVYGGGTTGLMGAIAKERVRLGGIETVLGVTPYGLIEIEREGRGKEALTEPEASKDGPMTKLKTLLGGSQSHTPEAKNDKQRLAPGWTDVVDLPPDPAYGQVVGVPTLSRRKALMVDFVQKGGPGSGFIALPGGFGSLDEILEVLTLRQLNHHSSQMVVCNTNGIWNGLRTYVDDASRQGFLGDESKSFLTFADTPELAINFFVQQRASAAWRLPAKELR